MVLGDHVAPDSVGGALMRLYEFTVGLVIAASAPAECITPPMKLYASVDRPNSPFESSNTFLPFCHSDTCAWQPLPVRLANGFGMKVARRPFFSAIDFTMNLKNACRSAVVSAESYSQFISNWPLASSWSFWYGPQPSVIMQSQISVMVS